MIRPDTHIWSQTVDDLFQLSLTAEHPRTRERFLALFQIASGLTSASDWARRSGRRPETVLGWVKTYNRHGPMALAYVRSGGYRPLFLQSNANNSSRRPNTRPQTSTGCPAIVGR